MTRIEEEVLGIFERNHALLKGHFLLSSGLHSDVYFEKFQVLNDPKYVDKLCKMLADKFRDFNVELVAGYATGGVLIAYEVAKHLGTKYVFGEDKNGTHEGILKRGFNIVRQQRVLIVDDVLTTGGSISKVIKLVEKYDAKILGLGVIIDRSGGKVHFDYELKSLYQTEAVTYQLYECPLCKSGIPLIRPGKDVSYSH